MNNIEIYSSETCAFCRRAKKLFKSMGLDYQEYDVSDNFDKMRDDLMQKYNVEDISTIPQIIINDTYVGGYDDLEILYKSGKLQDILK